MTALLEARGLSRSFGHVRALDGADFDVNPGEVVGLIGDNGAGKSTLIKALSGNLDLDAGEIYFEGSRVQVSGPRQAEELGIEVVYQDLALAPHLNPVQNVFLGREILRKESSDISGSWTRRRCAASRSRPSPNSGPR